ncbi:hypothetical protein Sbs19_39670 [Sphingobium sp. BS19]|nr:hypothetical protein Sbs19_39670 [Sphingobium sp. BS19]
MLRCMRLPGRATTPALSTLYTRLQGDFDGPIGEVLEVEDRFISCALGEAPQTNEVGRSASIAAALMVARKEFGLPFELLEIGASCGLNLNLGRYAFELGDTLAGMTDSSVHIAPRWRGPTVPWAAIDVVAARGTDINPLRVDDETSRERLLSYVWADQPQRARRLEKALAMAQSFQPRVDRHAALKWLPEQLKVSE